MDLNKAIQSRKSVKKFTTEKPNWRDIIECVDSARYAPMAGNNYSLKFIILDDKETIQKISEYCQQPFVAQTHYMVVVCSDPRRQLNAFEEKGRVFLRQQAGAAIQNFLLKIEEKGLATCWVGYFVEGLIKDKLKIPANIIIEALFPIGYEAPNNKEKRTKIELDRILYFNKYGNKKMKKERILEV